MPVSAAFFIDSNANTNHGVSEPERVALVIVAPGRLSAVSTRSGYCGATALV